MKLLNLASNQSFWRGIDYHHEIRKYVMSLTKAELREKLIRRMIDDLYY